MTALQKAALGTPPTGVDGDPTRTANTKFNSNVDVLNTQATLTSFATTLTAAQALTAANHLGKRVNMNLAAAGTINLPAASTCVADGVILLRNLGATLVTLAITAGSGDTIALTALAAGESALMDTDGAHAWNCLTRGRPSSLNESVLGNCAVSGNETVGGTLTVGGDVTAPNFRGNWKSAGYTLVSTTTNLTTSLTISPNGTANTGQITLCGVSDTQNSPFVAMYSTGANNIIHSSKTGTGAALPLDVYCNGAFNTRFYVGGGIGMGTTFATPLVNGAMHVANPQYQLVLESTAAAANKYWLIGPNSANNIVVFNQGAVGCYVADGSTAWAGQSDERLKNIRGEITGAVDAIKDIRTVRYTWKSDDDHAEALGVEKDSRVHVGVIAQDVQKHLPEAVSVSHDEYLGVAYTDLVPLCMAAIKELSAKVDSAQAQLNAAQAQITALQARAA